jgi:hypothetical protein
LLVRGLTTPGLLDLFIILENLAMTLLNYSTLLRGAIVKGALYHDDGVVFGPALVRAYELESQVALYPRIVITREVVLEARSSSDPIFAEDEGRSYILSSSDGPFYLNILSHMIPNLARSDGTERSLYLDRYRNIATKLQREYDASVDNPRHFAKHQWFAGYWNQIALEAGRDTPLIWGPGLPRDTSS